MEIKCGAVVLSAAGHDKDGVFAVIGFTDAHAVLIADGKRRKIEKPKKKKLKHLKPLGMLTCENPEITNRQLRKALKQFSARGSQGR